MLGGIRNPPLFLRSRGKSVNRLLLRIWYAFLIIVALAIGLGCLGAMVNTGGQL